MTTSKKTKRYEDATPQDRATNNWTLSVPRNQVVDGVELETNIVQRVHTMVEVTQHGVTFQVPKFNYVPVWPE